MHRATISAAAASRSPASNRGRRHTRDSAAPPGIPPFRRDSQLSEKEEEEEEALERARVRGDQYVRKRNSCNLAKARDTFRSRKAGRKI